MQARDADVRHHPGAAGLEGQGPSHQSGVVTLFVEARLFTDESGRPVSADGGMSGDAWANTLPGITSPRLAARLSRGESTEASEVIGTVVALPYYVGVGGLLSSLPRLVREVDRAVRSSDLVIARLPGIIGTIAILSATMRRKNRAAEVVGDIGEVLRVGVAGGLGRALAPVAEAVTAWSVKRAMAVRYVTREVLQAKYPARPTAAQVSLSGVKIDEVLRGRNVDQVIPGLILAVGSQEQLYKGHQILLEAVAHLSKRNPSTRLEIVGEGRYRGQLERMADGFGIADRVTFRGYIGDRAELNDRMDSCEVFAMPSLTEGLPRVLIEAMSRSVACVGTRVGGIPELLDDSMLCEPGDAVDLRRVLEAVMGSADLRREQGTRNSELAGSYQKARLSRDRQKWSDAILALAQIARDPGVSRHNLRRWQLHNSMEKE